MTSNLRDYQRDALSSLKGLDASYKSLVMPTGTGKTRVALQYGHDMMQDSNSVGYIVNSDAHVKQVVQEAESIDVDAVHIPGKQSSTVRKELIEDRRINIQDYDAGFKIGLFSYNGYFLGSEVPSADVLIIDDAHALLSERISYSAVILNENDWGRAYDRILEVILEANPLIKSEIESLEKPVHRGGDTVLVPPPSTAEVEEALNESISALTGGTGFEKYLLRQRLDASPNFTSWPCVVTAESICWRPFVLPFESFGDSPNRTMSEEEIVALTSMRDSERFLQIRLGTKRRFTQAELSERPSEMGTRVVIPYPALYSHSPPTPRQIDVIESWANRFGSVLVSMGSNYTFGKLSDRLNDSISLLRYNSPRSIDDFSELEDPRILGLVNRPSGIDIPSEICSTAIHLDLPYSTSGHEVVSGDIEESGTVSDASLAIRLSQLLGRLNRDPEDRSVHLILATRLPIRKGSVFVKALDPEVLVDLLIGERGIAREYREPTEEELLDHVSEFLAGDDYLREGFAENEDTLRDRLLGAEISEFTPNSNTYVEANLYAARGNFSAAAIEFDNFSQLAESNGYGAYASFYDFQSLVYSGSTGEDPEEVLGRQPESIIENALGRNPPSSALVGALRQMRAGPDEDLEEAPKQLARLEQKQQAYYRYLRWCDEVDGIPSESQRTDVNNWKEYWRARIRSPEHDELVDAYCDIFELLGTQTPQKEHEDNDASISWRSSAEDEFTLAIEAKGWNSSVRDEPPELTADALDQARDNANEISSDAVLLVTSCRAQERMLSKSSEDLGVYYLLEEGGVALADLISAQCRKLHQVDCDVSSVNDVPLDATLVSDLLSGEPGGEIDSHELDNLNIDL